MSYPPDQHATAWVAGTTALGPVLADLTTGVRDASYRWAAAVIPAGAAVLDLACGDGAGAELLAGVGSELVVTGVDREPHVEDARRRGRESVRFLAGPMGPEGIDSEPGSSEDLDGAFDVIVHVGDGVRSFDTKWLAGVLDSWVRPDGIVVLAWPAPADPVLGADLAALLARAGFEVVRFEGRAAGGMTVAATTPTDQPGTDASATDLVPGAPLVSFVLARRGQVDVRPWARSVGVAGVLDPPRWRAADAEVVGRLEAWATRAHRAEVRVRQLDALEEVLVDAEQTIAVLPDLREALAMAASERVLLEARLASVERARDDAIIERHNALARLEALKELEGLRIALDDAQVQVRQLRRSASWRITAPLRRLADVVRGHGG